jgi:retron-type reverse transcriptase
MSLFSQEYAENLEENLNDLHEGLRTKMYVAPPVERVWMEKDEKSKRPIGKPTFEDKVVQRAAVMLLGAIYEQDFYNCQKTEERRRCFSYRFYP